MGRRDIEIGERVVDMTIDTIEELQDLIDGTGRCIGNHSLPLGGEEGTEQTPDVGETVGAEEVVGRGRKDIHLYRMQRNED